MKCTREQYGSCFFSVFWICLRRKITRIWCVSSRSPIWPFHFICEGANGRFYHFFHVLPHKQNPWAPFWFLGHHEILASKEEVWELLRQSKRRYIIATRPAFVLIPCSLIWLLGCIPFTLAWAIYPWCWHSKWLHDGLSRLFRRTQGDKINPTDGDSPREHTAYSGPDE